MPMACRSVQLTASPLRHAAHRPQETAGLITTVVPISGFDTP
jgi:hypothetical protein